MKDNLLLEMIRKEFTLHGMIYTDLTERDYCIIRATIDRENNDLDEVAENPATSVDDSLDILHRFKLWKNE